LFLTDCPRCKASRITFNVLSFTIISAKDEILRFYEVFCVCAECHRSTVFVLRDRSNTYENVARTGLLKLGALNDYLDFRSFISLKDQAAVAPPEHIPEEIEKVFKEGATCLAVGCYNAAGTMFRLCVDLATRSMLPAEEVEGLNRKTRRDLGLRLTWLFNNGLLPKELQELSSCIKEDGNDGAHAGTLEKIDAEDLLDFTVRLLDRIYSEPERLRLAKERRVSRRSNT